MSRPRRAPADTSAITADHLGVSLGGPPVLHDVSFTIGPGESVGLFGSNGSGKTTLLRTLLGLVRPQRGESRLFGTPVSRFADWARVGYVPQHGTVSLEGATLGEVVASGRLARRRPFAWTTRADRAATAHAIAQVELTGLIDRPFAALSGGQQQRTLIARALAGEPDLLCLDEPLAGIDLPSQQQLADTLSALHEAGNTLLLVLHEAGPLRPALRRRLVLQDGQLTRDERDW